ncbi:tRNA (adenosine(37)-N6)-threonylcarbamoyltransferase complex dimerization subunit type 1 TsaB [Fluviicola sp.]|jgi:tRNA threonylcarbamoyladenosine biosynthesis protein TsaB|uniref:tRNA (adenosine(37)-N6)-threonylcarbamoyltransferase complex dimerization subunit type 1 TsaB n=1 Tax=Fluviicola sp. TaxID=1917219 RepID=UPI00282073FB|nr:tRNA (adenosine(37)-N6)-threonylcarbamoyltransferase complex dimerization subunit type 1 TsaB [Fluviicola sp.]MDR0803360.1 tRNA (adenosine(37)-N6)-threonylcarbamoyltransferase complex dimerization subunit type 1 TsaB [Fluviicola sp.]
MTTILHIETATKVCSVALSVDGELKQLQEFKDDGYAHGEQLTILVQQVMDQEKISFRQLSAVSVSSGPGSYTGLRIGVSTAKGLCYALNISLIAVSTLESMAVLGKMKYPLLNLCPMIDARRMEVFSLITDAQGIILKTASADVLDENSYKDFEPFVCFGDGASKMQELWVKRRLTFDTELAPSAQGQVAIAFQKFGKQEFEDVAYFEPDYLKEFYMPSKKT